VMLNIIPSPQTKVLVRGQKIAARITEIKFPPMKDHAIGSALMLTCDTKTPIYQIDENLSNQDQKKIRKLSGPLMHEIKKRNELFEVPELVESLYFIESLIFSLKGLENKQIAISSKNSTIWKGFEYKNTTATADSQNVEIINLLDIVEWHSDEEGNKITKTAPKQPNVTFLPSLVGYVWQDLSISRTCPIINYSKTLPKVRAGSIPIKIHPFVCIQKYMHNVQQYLAASQWYANEYVTKSKRDQAQNIWMAMKFTQK
jgi:hypothetical protein